MISRALPVAAVLAIVVATAARAEPRRFDFAGDTAGSMPKGFTCDHNGKGRPGKWSVVEDSDEAKAVKVLAQTDADTTGSRFPVCVADAITARDVDVSVRFRPISGSEDQAAGIVWRYKDAQNYYIVRANALEDNVVLYKMEKGRRSDLPLVGKGKTYGAKAPVPKATWSTLRVAAKGDLFEVYLNGQKLFEVKDTTFKDAGKVGVWTKADSVTHFTDLAIDAR
jgi:hypothetical protein